MNGEAVNRSALAAYWWIKACDSLESAEIEVKAEKYDFAINRMYYAMFYAVTALLTIQGKRFSKHAAVQTVFNRDLIKPGLIDIKYGKLYNRLFNNRQQADYEPLICFESAVVEKRLQEVNEFFQEFEPIFNNALEKLKAEENN